MFPNTLYTKTVIDMDFDCHQMAKTSWGHSSYHMVTKINFSHFEIGLVLMMAIEINLGGVEVG